jgi:microcin C transport system substrate-binding protein
MYHVMIRLVLAMALIMSVPTSFADADRSYQFSHGLSFLHDLKYSADYQHFNYVNPDAPKGGGLTLPSMQSFSSLAPLSFSSSSAPGLTWTYDTLLVRSGDEVSAFYGRLATGMAIAPDRLSIAFKLHPSARWHDGKPVVAQDVKFTLEAWMASATGVALLDWAESVEIADEKTVIIHTNADPAGHLRILGDIPILPAHYWVDKDPSENAFVPTLGSGPYRIAEARRGRFIRYERVMDYWGKDIPVNRGKFNFDWIQYDVYRDAVVAREALHRGLFDIWTEQDVLQWATSFDVPAFDNGWMIKGTRTYRVDIGARKWLIFNNEVHPFGDLLVREALTYALDFDWQNRVLHAGELERAQSYFNNSVFASRGLPSEDELALLEPFKGQIPERIFTDSFRFPRTDAAGHDRAGLLHAMALLKKAGWKLVDGVLVDNEGTAFAIEFIYNTAEDKRWLLPYLDSLEILGVKAKIRLVDTSEYINRARKRDYQAFIRAGDVGLPPWELYMSFHSDSLDLAYSYNSARIGHPAIDALVEHAASASRLDTMVTACRALDRVLLWNFFMIPLDALTDDRIVYWNKFGRPQGTADMYLSPFPDGWWYDEARAAQISTRSPR